MKRLIVTLTLALTLGLIIAHLSAPGMVLAGPESAISTAIVAQAAPAKAAPAKAAAPTKVEANKPITITMFVIIVLITLYIVIWAAKRTKTTADFYAARGAITGTQKRMGHRGGLHVRGLVPGDSGAHLPLRIRRLHVFGGVAGRVCDRAPHRG